MQVLGANTNYDVAMARQTFTNAAAECPFQKCLKNAAKGALADVLKQAAGSTDAAGTTTTSDASATTGSQAAAGDSKKIEGKLNEMIAVGMIAPMLAEALGKFQQTYFANSPAEQAYAKQLYMEIATKIGQSSKLPLAKSIAKAVEQRLGTAATTATATADKVTG